MLPTERKDDMWALLRRRKWFAILFLSSCIAIILAGYFYHYSVTHSILSSGVWAGKQTSGNSSFDTKLVITAVNYTSDGGTFTGTWGISGPGQSSEPIMNGSFYPYNGVYRISFSTATQIQGIVATYVGSISGKSITGTWSEPGGSSGTFAVKSVI